MSKRIAEVDFDDATYIGDEEDGVYVGVAEGPDGWYVSSVVDCNSAGFVETLVSDDGPYPTEVDALQAGVYGAKDWCVENDVRFDEDEQPTRTKGDDDGQEYGDPRDYRDGKE